MEVIKNTSSLKDMIQPFTKLLADTQGFRRIANRLSAHGTLNASTHIVPDPDLPLFDTLRASRRQKGLYGYEAFEGQTHVLTYYKAKGREFDIVVMVVDPRRESTRVSLEEKRRLYYVSATRAKKALIVIHFGRETGDVLGPVLGN